MGHIAPNRVLPAISQEFSGRVLSGIAPQPINPSGVPVDQLTALLSCEQSTVVAMIVHHRVSPVATRKPPLLRLTLQGTRLFPHLWNVTSSGARYRGRRQVVDGATAPDESVAALPGGWVWAS